MDTWLMNFWGGRDGDARGVRSRLPHAQDVPVGPDQLGTQGTMGAGSGEPSWAALYEMAMINAHDGRPSAVSADTPAAGLEMITGEAARESDSFGQPSFGATGAEHG